MYSKCFQFTTKSKTLILLSNNNIYIYEQDIYTHLNCSVTNVKSFNIQPYMHYFNASPLFV